MNENHARVCPSPEWAEHLQTEVLPVVAGWADLGSTMLEVGPGPGATTEWLRHRVDRLIAVEAEADAAAALATRFAGGNVEVVHADATSLGWEEGAFDSVGSFTMLHHVPTLALQNRLLGEAFRVLRPGGALVGSDSPPSDARHHFHVDDVYYPVDPASFVARLQTLGFVRITLRIDPGMMWVAHKPTAD